nr:YggS family pyridoxal phosphate-dependent enzyme [Maliibacterium massiliense]
MEQLQDRIEAVRARIAQAAARAGRDPQEITLIAAIKTQDCATVQRALALGITDVGENRVQELAGHAPALLGRSRLHFIGQLQRNKVKYIISCVDAVHSLDRAALAEEIERQAARAGRTVDVLLQLRLEDAPQRGGAALDEAPALLECVLAKAHLRLRGVMCVPPLDVAPAAAFAQVRQARDALKARYPEADLGWLSMGMTHDFEIAIAQGATHVRIGTALFGPRDVQQQK